MKIKIILFSLFVLISDIFSQPFILVDSLHLNGVSGDLEWGDFDNDGDLDLFVAGSNSDEKNLMLYENLGNDEFKEKSIPEFLGFSSGCDINLADLNNDGFIDLFICGGNDLSNTSKIYKNISGLSFELVSTTTFPAVQNASADLGDYDNDGDLDILISGFNYSEIYRNNGSFIFSKHFSQVLPKLQYGKVRWINFDNDSDLDILITGYNGAVPSSYIYTNNGDNTFTEKNNINLSGFELNDIDIGDYDNDSDIDILISGHVPGVNSATIIYQNNDGTFSELQNTNFIQAQNGSVNWGDYNNDGSLDFVVSGFSNSGRKTQIYKNDGNNSFTLVDSIIIEGISGGAAKWGDYDNDGDLDLGITGFDGSTEIIKIYQNLTYISNSVPSIPQNISISSENQDVTISWDPSDDLESGTNGISYNISIEMLGVNYLISPMANTNSGWRHISKIGNAGYNTSIELKNILPGDYSIAVQAIDNSFKASKFSSVSYFTVVDGQITIFSPNGGEVLEAGSIYEIKWYSSSLTYPPIIELSTDNKVTWSVIYAASSVDETSYFWEIPNDPSEECYIRIKNVVDSSIIDYSDEAFSIVIPTIVDEDKSVIDNFELSQNYPNPFNPVTTIKYTIPLKVKSDASTSSAAASSVKLIVYDIVGREVATLVNQKQNPGNYSVSFDATDKSSGIYYYTLTSGIFRETKKMVLLK